MRMVIAVIAGVLLFSEMSIASNTNNPFLLPSERIDPEDSKAKTEQIECEVNPSQIESEPSDLAKMLVEELEQESSLPEYHPDVLGQWTRKDILNSRYIGLINGHKVYFHKEKQIFFNLDLSKSKSED